MGTKGQNLNHITFDEFAAYISDPTPIYSSVAIDSITNAGTNEFTIRSAETRRKRREWEQRRQEARQEAKGTYMMDLWGRAGILEDPGPKPKDPHEHRLATSGMGDTVTIKCSCSWSWKGDRKDAERAAESHYASPEGVRSPVQPKGANHTVTLEEVTIPNGNRMYRVTCRTCRFAETHYAHSDAANAAIEHSNGVRAHTVAVEKTHLTDSMGRVEEVYRATCQDCQWRYTGPRVKDADIAARKHSQTVATPRNPLLGVQVT